MAERIFAIRGMNDILPEKTALWRAVEQHCIDCLASYGYQEIRLPIVESTQLFKRTIGEVTDIVEKEMYTFADLNGDSISLRPEGTAGCVRACLEHGLLHHQQQKLWYLGPMFRHERPQKGRYRQFNHFGVEVFGIPGVAIELELIAIAYRLWTQLDCAGALQLQVNSLGSLSERQTYKKLLVDYLCAHKTQLDEDSLRRLERNPLRILDSKNPALQSLIAEAPKLIDTLGKESRAHFDAFCDGLETLNIPYQINSSLVRGLDYYGHTVFEWVTDKLGSQATVCAGGRYDILVEQLGGDKTPAVGFALGLERLLLLIETLDRFPLKNRRSAVFIMSTHEAGMLKALTIAESIRHHHPELEVITNTALGSLKTQFKKADKSGARLALILGEDELAKQQISIKDLRQDIAQQTIEEQALQRYLSSVFAGL
jgi:histidyl-tRNA synthetase